MDDVNDAKPPKKTKVEKLAQAKGKEARLKTRLAKVQARIERLKKSMSKSLEAREEINEDIKNTMHAYKAAKRYQDELMDEMDEY